MCPHANEIPVRVLSIADHCPSIPKADSPLRCMSARYLAVMNVAAITKILRLTEHPEHPLPSHQRIVLLRDASMTGSVTVEARRLNLTKGRCGPGASRFYARGVD